MPRSPLDPITAASAHTTSTEGYEMPAHYGDPTAEYRAAGQSAALRDASHLGLLTIGGADHLDFLHRMSTNDFANAAANSGLTAVFPDSRGRILEAGDFYRLADATLAVLAPGGQERLPQWLDRYLFTEAVTFAPHNGDSALLELSGPDAAAIAQKVLSIDLSAVADKQIIATDTPLTLARHDQWSHPGLRLFGPADALAELWPRLHKAGARPLGEEAWDLRRIQHGLPVHGRELTDAHNPWEANLADAIHMNKGCYIGQEVIARLDTYAKVKQRLRGLVLPPGSLPAADTPLSVDGRQAGRLTSACQPPDRDHPIALAYVRRDFWEAGTRVQLGDDGPEATVADLPLAAEG